MSGCWQLFSQCKLLLSWVFAPKLLPSPAIQDRGEVSHTDTGQLFGLTAAFNIWISSCEVINRSKREFRLKGEEIPLRQLIQSIGNVHVCDTVIGTPCWRIGCVSDSLSKS